jgi:DnaJ-class molecular chaperone
VTGHEWLAVLLVLTAAAWVVSLAWHPYRPCPRCEGRRGRNVGSKPGRFGRCGKCDGRGEQVRRGARSVRKGIGRPL